MSRKERGTQGVNNLNEVLEMRQTLEVWGGDAAHNVGVDRRAVEQPHMPGQLLLQQWAVCSGVHNLEVTL